MQNSYLTELSIKYDLNKQFCIYDIPDKKLQGKDIIKLIPTSGYDVFADFKTNVFNKKNKLIKGTVFSFSETVLLPNLFSLHKLRHTFEIEFKPFEKLYIHRMIKTSAPGEFRIQFWTEPEYIVKLHR